MVLNDIGVSCGKFRQSMWYCSETTDVETTDAASNVANKRYQPPLLGGGHPRDG